MENINKNIYDILFNNNEVYDKLYSDMSTYQKRLFKGFKEDKNTFYEYSLNDLLFDFDKDFIEKILEIELDIYLEEIKGTEITNKRNGYTKDIDLTIGNKTINFNRPRLRKEKDFDSCFIPKRTRIMKDITDNILLLYSKNNSVNDIKDILKNMFKIDVSTAFISKVVQTISEEVLTWRNKDLQKCYFCINIDCTYVSIRDHKYLNSHDVPIYIVIGTTLEGTKECLGIYLGNEDENKNVIDYLHTTDIGESKTFWMTVFNDLQDRGVEEILYICSDGIGGIENAIKDTFPNSKHQRCIVHLVRNVETYITSKNKKEIIDDFKNIYSAPNKETAKEYYESFLAKYKKHKTLCKHVESYYNLIIPLFDIPVNIRKYIYTNNISESANSKIKRGFYGRGALPNTSSAINITYFAIKDLESKWKNKKVNNWDNIFNEISIVHKDIIEKYL